ncbi:MAG: fumarate hydratase [Clostridia bacterium]|nr:fumarate hydratase [Clostridia bacterium]
MRNIDAKVITEAVRELFISANVTLPADARQLIENASVRESDPRAKGIFSIMCENLDAAASEGVPICQDTGMAVLFAEVGQDVHIAGAAFEDAVNEGVRRAYTEGYLRKSVVKDPLFGRENTNDNTPAVIHTRIVPGDRIKLTAAPKGFGSENMSAIKMFTPSASRDDIIEFVADTVRRAGGNPCPPVCVGVGIGGDFEYSAILAKKALARPVSLRADTAEYRELEADMLAAVNKLGIGAQGFGGDVTALAVNIEHYPTHIAGLPVAVNINCHVMRHKEVEI